MDWPFYAFFNKVYDWQLNRTDPPEAERTNFQYIPALISKPFGLGWNRRWYSDVAKQSGVEEKLYIKNRPARHMPASCNNYQHDMEAVRKISHGLIAFDNNLSKVKAYTDFVDEERRCMDTCRAGPSIKEYEGEHERCRQGCKIPRLLMLKGLQKELEKWRDDSLTCMKQHSLTQGDGDSEAFERCVHDFGEKIAVHATERDRLNEFIGKYYALFQSTGSNEDWLSLS